MFLVRELKLNVENLINKQFAHKTTLGFCDVNVLGEVFWGTFITKRLGITVIKGIICSVVLVGSDLLC